MTKLTANVLLSKEECEMLLSLCEDNEECEDLHFKFYRAARLLRKKEKTAETNETEDETPAAPKVRGRRKKVATASTE